jgi:hypothetical protein
MSGVAFSYNIAAFIKARLGLAPVASTGSYQAGVAIDRQGYLSALGKVVVQTSGGVTGGAVKGKFTHSDTSGGTYTDVGSEVSVTIGAGPNATAEVDVPINLAEAKRYIKLNVDSDPTGGTPASTIAGVVILGGSDKLPA